MTTRKEYQKKICLLGDGAVGKTSLIRKFVMDVFDDKYIATVGTKVSRKSVALEFPEKDLHVDLTLMIWDVVGQKEYQKLRLMYYQGANGALVVCDMTRKETLDGLKDWASSIKQSLGDIPLIFLVNKSDLEEQRKITDEDIKAMAENFGASHIYTSALTGKNVEKAFQDLSSLMVKP